MIEYIIIGFLLAVIGVGCYIINNLLNKIAVYEEWVGTFQSKVENIYIRLKEVDDRNLFEKDDDVGFVFSEILNVVDEFNKEIK